MLAPQEQTSTSATKKFTTQHQLTVIKGPDNPTCQLLIVSSKRKLKTGWERQERERRWWKTDRVIVACEKVVCEQVVCENERVVCERAVGVSCV